MRRDTGGLFAILAVATLLVLAATATSSAQSKSTAPSLKYWISFTDKNNGLGKGPATVEAGFVSERALERRRLRGTKIPEDADVPVSAHYESVLRTLGVSPISESRWLNAVSAFLTPDQLEAVTKLDFVRSVSPVARSVDMSAPPEPVVVAKNEESYSAENGYLLDYGQSLNQLELMNAVTPIEAGYTGKGLLLGFLDTTTDTLHPALEHLYQSGRVVGMRDFTVEAGLAPQSNKHGLYTSSTALGFAEGELIGACYDAEYIFATTEYAPSETNQEEDFFVEGMEWMERMGADIVNVSLGYSVFDAGQQSYTYEDMDGNTAKTTIAADMAVELGVVVVTSAGNEGCSSPDFCWYYITSPADGNNVITAGAVDPSGLLVSFSGRGPTYDGRTKPDLAAQGSGVWFASSNGGYGSGSGTSFSSPLLASVACQVLQANPSLNPFDIRNILRSTASQAENPDNLKGWGIPNADAAVEMSKNAVTATDPDLDLPQSQVELAIYPNPASGKTVVGVSTGAPASSANLEIRIYDILGRRMDVKTTRNDAGDMSVFNLDLTDMAPGLYLVRAQGEGFQSVKNLVVQ